MQSRTQHHPRNRWAHCNTPAALRRRRALLDARREAAREGLPPIPADPEPGSVWCVVQVVGAAGVIHSRALYVPARGKRCDQHADADGRLVNATRLAEWLRASIPKRPSYAERAEARQTERGELELT